MKYFYVFLLLWGPVFLKAVEIRFPEEELAPESVLPVFEKNKRATMNRRVQFKHKLGVNSSFAGRMDEPFLHPFAFTGSLEFFFTETHGVRLSGLYFWPGLSHNGLNIQKVYSAFQPGKIHHPQFGFFFSYALAPLYGKISLAKNIVTNLNLSVYLGLGALALDLDYSRFPSDLRWTYAGWIEFNQKIFIGRRFYFHGFLSFLIYQAPNPVWCKRTPELGKAISDDVCDFYVNQREVMSYEKADMDILFRTIVGGGVGGLLF